MPTQTPTSPTAQSTLAATSTTTGKAVSPTATIVRMAYPLPSPRGNATTRAPYPLPAQLVTTTAPPTASPTSNIAGAEMNANEQKMFALINAERVKAGLKPLVVDATFQLVAHARSADMVARKYYSHNDPVTGEMAARAMLLKAGVTIPMSENFYVSWPNDGNAVNKAMAWLISDKVHRDNMLSPRWTVVGVGAVADPPGNLLVMTQVFGLLVK